MTPRTGWPFRRPPRPCDVRLWPDQFVFPFACGLGSFKTSYRTALYVAIAALERKTTYALLGRYNTFRPLAHKTLNGAEQRWLSYMTLAVVHTFSIEDAGAIDFLRLLGRAAGEPDWVEEKLIPLVEARLHKF